MEEKFIEAMKKVDYSNTLNHDDVFNELNLTSSKVFNNNLLFIAFEKARKKYLKEN